MIITQGTPADAEEILPTRRMQVSARLTLVFLDKRGNSRISRGLFE
jgi:hypothetical protein